jgi:transcriptional/translational regulatory protein YebC/TACO1
MSGHSKWATIKRQKESKEYTLQKNKLMVENRTF